MWNIPAKAEATLLEQGFFIDENVLSPDVLQKIKKEIDAWRNIPAINGYGNQFHSDDALIQNLSLLSPAALKLALSDDILNFMERIFGEKTLLGKLEYRRALMKKIEMPTHSDGNDDYSVFIYLNGVDPKYGSTAVLPKTHKLIKTKNQGYIRIPEQAQKETGVSFIAAEGKPGTCLIFNNNIWHKRTETDRPGREIIWLTYTPVSRAKDCVELTFSSTSLQGLTERQKAALGMGLNQPFRPGEDFNLSKQLNPASLYFLSDGFLLLTLVYRLIRHIRNLIPRPIKKSVRKYIDLLKGNPK